MSKCTVNSEMVEAYVLTLTEKEGDKVIWLSKRLEEQGANLPNFNGNWAKVVQNSRHQPELLELRATVGQSVIRIAYYIDKEENIAYLLWGGDKRGVKEKLFYKRLIREGDNAIDSLKEAKLKQDTEK